MKQAELVYREILYSAIEQKNRTLTQAAISRKLSISLSAVNAAVKAIERIGAVEVLPRNFKVVDIKKILYFWASIRNVQKDIIYSTRVEQPVTEIEKSLPDNAVFAAYTAHKLMFGTVPADYSEVYAYCDESIKKRFLPEKGTANLFVLKKDGMIEKYGKTTTVANTFVDLWNLREWYAKEFVKTLEETLHGVLE